MIYLDSIQAFMYLLIYAVVLKVKDTKLKLNQVLLRLPVLSGLEVAHLAFGVNISH